MTDLMGRYLMRFGFELGLLGLAVPYLDSSRRMLILTLKLTLIRAISMLATREVSSRLAARAALLRKNSRNIRDYPGLQQTVPKVHPGQPAPQRAVRAIADAIEHPQPLPDCLYAF